MILVLKKLLYKRRINEIYIALVYPLISDQSNEVNLEVGFVLIRPLKGGALNRKLS
jgi:hypothetical protein